MWGHCPSMHACREHPCSLGIILLSSSAIGCRLSDDYGKSKKHRLTLTDAFSLLWRLPRICKWRTERGKSPKKFKLLTKLGPVSQSNDRGIWLGPISWTHDRGFILKAGCMFVRGALMIEIAWVSTRCCASLLDHYRNFKALWPCSLRLFWRFLSWKTQQRVTKPAISLSMVSSLRIWASMV